MVDHTKLIFIFLVADSFKPGLHSICAYWNDDAFVNLLLEMREQPPA